MTDTYRPKHARTQYDALTERYTDAMAVRVCLGTHCAGIHRDIPHRNDRMPRAHLRPVPEKKVSR